MAAQGRITPTHQQQVPPLQIFSPSAPSRFGRSPGCAPPHLQAPVPGIRQQKQQGEGAQARRSVSTSQRSNSGQLCTVCEPVGSSITTTSGTIVSHSPANRHELIALVRQWHQDAIP